MESHFGRVLVLFPGILQLPPSVPAGSIASRMAIGVRICGARKMTSTLTDLVVYMRKPWMGLPWFRYSMHAIVEAQGFQQAKQWSGVIAAE